MSADLPLEPLNVIAHRVGETLRARGQTVAVAESSAGGLVSAALLAIPGASAFFLGGAVVYSRRAGKALMGLTAADMVGMRAETEPYARMMAARVRDMHRATWGLCESGAAGPSGSPYGDAAGHVCVAVAGTPDSDAPGSDAAVHSRTLATGLSDRPANMDLFARELLRQFDEVLQAAAP
ncbi:MAG: CinA family protein [Comamonadaceae bacterium]|nr:MAG: CinA family protein [Comamonadaceae bacterium]